MAVLTATEIDDVALAADFNPDHGIDLDHPAPVDPDESMPVGDVTEWT